jgi:hypothetical protein
MLWVLAGSCAAGIVLRIIGALNLSDPEWVKRDYLHNVRLLCRCHFNGGMKL